jgi:hypothetical protein
LNEKLGKYELVRQIGTGSFGLVYEAFDPHLKRSVAIKVCTARDEQARLRFHREAEIAGNLVHPNLTTVHDFGFHADVPYLVEEYLEGENLDTRMRNGRLAFSQQLDILIQLTRGLAYAHAEGVVHRDIKPSNVRILYDDSLKILDFGVAKRTDAESKLTQVGSTVGTAAYLSPEILRGADASPASDIFSFGVVAYQILTGRKPFTATSIAEVLSQILHEQHVPVNRIWHGCPAALAAAVERCLAKEPAERYPDCREIAEGLEAIGLEVLGGPLPDGFRAEVVPPVGLEAAAYQEGLIQRGQDLLRGGDRPLALTVLSSARGVGQGSSRLETLLRRARGRSAPAPAPAPEGVSDGDGEDHGEALEEARAKLEALLYIGSFQEVGGVLVQHRDLFTRAGITGALRDDLTDRLASAARAVKGRAGHLVADAVAAGRSHWKSENLLAARRLLQAVTPLEAEQGEAHQVLHLVAATSRGGSSSRQAEIFASIEGLLTRKRFGEAGEALRFAVSLGIPDQQLSFLRHRVTAAFEDELGELRDRWDRAREALASVAPGREPDEPSEGRRLLAKARGEVRASRYSVALETLLAAARAAPDDDEIHRAIERVARGLDV